ncbi:MAG: HEPN domain-containing protein [Phycisphaerae bacterium]|nr:HEPN domain-containing protein [Phycisphaerae bacterium]
MNSFAADLWGRAVDALCIAGHDLAMSPDAAASRAYYAAFYAVSAYFALQDKTFSRHSAVEAAVHRDLVRPGIWTEAMGKGFSRLGQLRNRGDYGGNRHVSGADAKESIRIASEILQTVAGTNSELFTGLDKF